MMNPNQLTLAALAVALLLAALWVFWRRPTANTPPRDTAVSEAEQHLVVPGPAEAGALVFEVCATLLESGLPLRSVLHLLGSELPGCAALSTVARALDGQVPWATAWEAVPPQLRGLGEALYFTELTGAPAAEMLRSGAAAANREISRAAEERAAAFGVRLVLPLGLCALPAFICLGVVPLLISLLPRT